MWSNLKDINNFNERDCVYSQHSLETFSSIQDLSKLKLLQIKKNSQFVWRHFLQWMYAENVKRTCVHVFLHKVELHNFHVCGNFVKERKDIEEKMGVKRNFLPDSALPSWPLPRASFLSVSAFGFAFTRTTTTSSSGGGGGGGGGGFERLENKKKFSV